MKNLLKIHNLTFFLLLIASSVLAEPSAQGSEEVLAHKPITGHDQKSKMQFMVYESVRNKGFETAKQFSKMTFYIAPFFRLIPNRIGEPYDRLEIEEENVVYYTFTIECFADRIEQQALATINAFYAQSTDGKYPFSLSQIQPMSHGMVVITPSNLPTRLANAIRPAVKPADENSPIHTTFLLGATTRFTILVPTEHDNVFKKILDKQGLDFTFRVYFNVMKLQVKQILWDAEDIRKTQAYRELMGKGERYFDAKQINKVVREAARKVGVFDYADPGVEGKLDSKVRDVFNQLTEGIQKIGLATMADASALEERILQHSGLELTDYQPITLMWEVSRELEQARDYKEANEKVKDTYRRQKNALEKAQQNYNRKKKSLSVSGTAEVSLPIPLVNIKGSVSVNYSRSSDVAKSTQEAIEQLNDQTNKDLFKNNTELAQFKKNREQRHGKELVIEGRGLNLVEKGHLEQNLSMLGDYLAVRPLSEARTFTTSSSTPLLGRTHCLAESENNQTIKRHQNHQHIDCNNFYERQQIKVVDKTTQKPISKFKIEQLVEGNLDEPVKITVFADNYFPKTVIVNQCPITVELEKIVQPSDILYDQEGNPSYILVIQDKAPVFNAPRESKKVMQAYFGMARYIADEFTFHGKTYYLMVDLDSNRWEIEKFLGWISADSVLRDPKPISEKGIALKGLIIHNWQIDTSEHLDISMTHAYKGPSQRYAPNTKVGLFHLFFAFAQQNDYTLLAKKPILTVESADTQLLGWVADKNLHFWKTRRAIEFDKTTVEQRKVGVKVFATRQELFDFYFMNKKIEPLAEEDLGVKTPLSPILMRYPIISEGSKQYPYLGNMYQIGVISDKIYIDKETAGLTHFQEIKSRYGPRIALRLTKLMQKKGINPRHFIAASAEIFQPGWVTVKEPGTGVQQVREVLLISRMDLEGYAGLLSTFVKKPITKKAIMSTWKRALEENLGEVDMNKPVSELVQARLGLPVKNKILQLTLKEISQLGGRKLREFRQALYKDLLYLRSFAQEERIEAVEDKNSQFGWKPVRKGTRKVWWKFGDTFEYGWIPLDVMP